MNRIVWPLISLLSIAVSGAAFAARPLYPPVEELKSSPELVRVVAVVAGQKQEPPRVKFAITDRFSGESPDQMSLRLDEAAYEDVIPGQGYILAWTDMRKVKLVRKAYEKDPDGPSVVQVRGLDTLALFEDSPEMRFLFSARDAGDRYCCKGCEYVAEMISDQGFDQFYDLKEGWVLAPVKSRPFEQHDFSWFGSMAERAEGQAPGNSLTARQAWSRHLVNMASRASSGSMRAREWE